MRAARSAGAPEAPAQVTISTIRPQLNKHTYLTSNIWGTDLDALSFAVCSAPGARIEKNLGTTSQAKKSIYLILGVRTTLVQKSARGSEFLKIENTFYFFSRKR